MMPPSQSSEDFAMRIVETCARRPAGAVVEVAHFSPESAARAIDRAREIARSIGVRIDHVTLRVMGAKR